MGPFYNIVTKFDAQVSARLESGFHFSGEPADRSSALGAASTPPRPPGGWVLWFSSGTNARQMLADQVASFTQLGAPSRAHGAALGSCGFSAVLTAYFGLRVTILDAPA